MNSGSKIQILTYQPQLAQYFKEINKQWIESMFYLEEKESHILENPEKYILDRGGAILFAELHGKVVGTGALKKTGSGEFELTKMGVLESARGAGVGKVLLYALIERAKQLEAACLYLLTNKKCEAAISIYERAGFVHCPEIMSRFGGEYERCNVAMRYSAGA